MEVKFNKAGDGMDNLRRAMTYSYPSEIPMSVSMLPRAWIVLGQELVRLAREYPDFFPEIPDPERIRESLPPRYRAGTWTDEWGCVWENEVDGMDAIVRGHPLPTRESVRSLRIPENRDGSLPHGFMYLRLLDLRGFEEAMIDFAEECEELQLLIDRVLEYNLLQTRVLLETAGPVAYFGDDLGMQNGLAIGAEKWRKYLKPCFRRIFGLVKDSGRLVYLHSDGQIYEIMPDLRECGADMLNPQYRANGLDNLIRVCKGKIPIRLDLDRQLFPFATPPRLRDHVRECVEGLYLPQGGLALHAELNYEVPLQNMAALMDAMRAYKGYRG